jgi:hypothetical protein
MSATLEQSVTEAKAADRLAEAIRRHKVGVRPSMRREADDKLYEELAAVTAPPPRYSYIHDSYFDSPY